MTNDEKRIAIAEKCGWVWYRIPYHAGETHYRCLCLPILHEYEGQAECWLVRADGSERICNMKYIENNGHVPNYPEDLNAMHEAWNTLTDAQKVTFYQKLGNNPKFCALVKNNVVTRRHLLLGATAEDYADAFLLTHGFKL